jgi:hypothetical protein
MLNPFYKDSYQEVVILWLAAGTITNKACNQVHWSPQGRHIVLAGLKGLNGQLEFFSVDEMETMAAAEHFMCTDVDWDPTGVYFGGVGEVWLGQRLLGEHVKRSRV